MSRPHAWILAALLCSSLAARADDGPAAIVPSDVELQLAKKFAPLVVLARDEPYLPSSIEFYAPHVSLRCKGNVAHGPILAVAGKLPDAGKQTSECFLTTNEPMKGPDQILGFFHGEDPTKKPVPVYVSFYKSRKNGALNIQYLTFFPYNWGKNVCLTLAPKDHCMGKRHQMDNHVGDWEGLTVQVQNNKVVGVRVGAHAASKIGYTFLASAQGKCPNEGGS